MRGIGAMAENYFNSMSATEGAGRWGGKNRDVTKDVASLLVHCIFPIVAENGANMRQKHPIPNKKNVFGRRI